MTNTNKLNIQIDIPFKGKRNYLQGPSFYDAITEALDCHFEKNQIWVNHIVFRDFAKNKCTISVGARNTPQPSLVKGMFRARMNNETIQGLILETEEAVEKRIEYDEDLITKVSTVKGNGIFQRNRSGFSAIEEIVSLTKHLHYHNIPEPNGKWIFSQLDLSQPFSSDNDVLYSIYIKQNLANKMTVSEINENDITIGKIRFTVAAI